MSDRRRVAGPEGSVRPILAPEIKPDPHAPLLDSELCRRDGRFPEQARAFVIQPGAASRASGSAYIEAGKTKIICSVYGPRSSLKQQKAYQTSGSLNCEIEFMPFCSEGKRRGYQRDTEGQEMSLLLSQALEPAVRRELFPNAVVDVFVTVLQDDGSVLAAAITAAGVALLQAGIEMFDSIIGCSIAFNESSLVLMDPTASESASLQRHQPTMTIAFMPNLNEVAQIFLIGGSVDIPILQESLNLAMDGCRSIYQQSICQVVQNF